MQYNKACCDPRHLQEVTRSLGPAPPAGERGGVLGGLLGAMRGAMPLRQETRTESRVVREEKSSKVRG
jgi:hypothetical protein